MTATQPKIPFINLDEQHRAMRDEIKAALDPIIDSAGFILGPDVAKFESAFAEFCNAKHCISLNSGTAALHLALMALAIGPGDEVITQANSFIATAEAISFVGATPVFVDAHEASHTICVDAIEKAITPKTRAIIPVHLYGQPCDMDAIMAIAKRHSLKVVEDACQAHGATYKGRVVGTFGDIGCFSFYPGKNLGAAGDGGAVVTNDTALAEHVKKIRDHGSVKKYEHEIIGHNFRLDTIQAAILLLKMKHLKSWNEKRRSNALYYNEKLKGVANLIIPEEMPERKSVWHLYVIRVPNRAEVQQALTEANIQSGIHYPKPIHLQPAYAFLGIKPGACPVSEKLADEVLSLPMYPDLTREQQDRVVEVVKKAVASTSKKLSTKSLAGTGATT